MKLKVCTLQHYSNIKEETKTVLNAICLKWNQLLFSTIDAKVKTETR